MREYSKIMDKGYYKRVANRTRSELDSRNPKLRLSIIAYLLDHVKPLGADELLGEAKAINDWITEDAEAYFTELGELEDPQDEGDSPLEEKNAYDIIKTTGGGYV